MPDLISKKRDCRKGLVFLFPALLSVFLTVGLSPCAGLSKEIAPEDELTHEKLFGRTFSRTSLRILTIGLAGVILARPGDDDMRKNWQGDSKMSHAAADFGDFLGTGVPGGVLSLVQYYFDPVNGAAHMKTLVAGTTWTYGLKTIYSRKRPGSSGNYQSFPSGHTSTAFASASSLWYAYGWKAGVPAVALATFTGFSRIAKDAHFLSDVIAGAAVGTWMGYAYAVPNQLPARSPNLKGPEQPPRPSTIILPSFGNETFFLSLSSEF